MFARQGTMLKVDTKELHEDDYVYSDEDNEDSDEGSVEGADEAKQALS